MGEGRYPLLRDAIALVHRGTVFVVDVDAVNLIGEHEMGHHAGSRDRVHALCRLFVHLTEQGDRHIDARACVLDLLRGADVWRECGVRTRLVERTAESEKVDREDFPALRKRNCQHDRVRSETAGRTSAEMKQSV